MLNRFKLLFILFIGMVFISGCIDNGDQNQVNTDDSVILKTNLPAGFTFMGDHEIQIEIGGNLVNAAEGVYRYGEEDVYIQVIKTDKPDVLLTLYKEDLKKEYKSDFDPFDEISFNGHKATQVTDYSIINGQQKSRYSVIWANDKYMILVGKSFEVNTVITLATATGN